MPGNAGRTCSWSRSWTELDGAGQLRPQSQQPCAARTRASSAGHPGPQRVEPAFPPKAAPGAPTGAFGPRGWGLGGQGSEVWPCNKEVWGCHWSSGHTAYLKATECPVTMQSDRRSPDSAAVTLPFVPIRDRGMRTPDINILSYANYSSNLVKKKKGACWGRWTRNTRMGQEGKASEALP